MTSKGLGFHMKTGDHKTRKHTTPHCQTKWTSSVAIDTDTYTGEFGWDWAACDCYSLQGGRSSKTMGKHGNTLRSSQSSQKKVLWSTESKDTVSKAQWSCIDDHTHVVNSDAGFGNVGCQNDLSYSGRWSLKHQPDGRWQLRVPVRTLRNGDITTLWKCMSQNVFNQSCLHSHCAKRNGAWWWMTRCMFKPKWLLIFVLQGAVQVENPWVCRVLRKLKS